MRRTGLFLRSPSVIISFAAFFLTIAFVTFVPSAHAATVLSGQSITISSSTPDNAYLFAGQVSVYAPLPDDLCAAGGTVTVQAPIAGEALLAGGTVDIERSVAGDARIIGGRVSDEDTVGGDLMVAGGAVSVSGKPKDAYIVGGTVDMTNGSDGPVTIYGADVTLSGEFNGDVEVVASDKITVGENTVIHGAFKYNAPEQADIPVSAHIDGGVNYIGSAAWLPTVKQAKTYATAGIWVFFLVRVTAALVAAGLIAGLFPVFADRIVEAALRRTPERFTLLTLLGFAGFIATPVLIIFLLISFVGIGIALLFLAAYALFLLLSYVYAAIIAGAAFMYLFRKHAKVSWRVAILGVVVLSLIGSLPYVGFIIKVLLSATAGGALLSLFYNFAFKRDTIDISKF